MGDDDDLLRKRWGGRARATGRIALSAAQLAARRALRRSGARDAALGEALARELDGMKGMAMKVGQILSYFDGVLPEETHAALQKLQQGSRNVPFERMRPVVERALGASLDELFDDFDAEPVAAASIGQVYRATLDGQPVAVKVQYPGIEDTIAGDFARLDNFARLASLASAVDGKALVRELRETFVEECDYRREARHQDAFARAFSEDRDVTIPAVVPERSARTVLTTTWARGHDFYRFERSASQERKDDVALVLARFAYRSLFHLGTLNADPHPGNYLFGDDGAVTFLDFGCVRRFAPDYLEQQRTLELVVVEDRRRDFDDALLATGVVDAPARFDFDLHWRLMCHQLAPYRAPVFTFTREYLRAGLDFSSPKNPNLRHLKIPPPWIWQQRLQWGLHAVLVRLGARGAFRDVYRDALASAHEPLRVEGLST